MQTRTYLDQVERTSNGRMFVKEIPLSSGKGTIAASQILGRGGFNGRPSLTTLQLKHEFQLVKPSCHHGLVSNSNEDQFRNSIWVV